MNSDVIDELYGRTSAIVKSEMLNTNANVSRYLSAEDVVQDLAVEALEHNNSAALVRWKSRRRVRGCIVGYARAAKRDVRKTTSLEAAYDHAVIGPNPCEQAILAESTERMNEAIALLSERHQKVVRMRYFESKSLNDIAIALGYSVNCGRWAAAVLAEALQDLRDIFPNG